MSRETLISSHAQRGQKLPGSKPRAAHLPEGHQMNFEEHVQIPTSLLAGPLIAETSSFSEPVSLPGQDLLLCRVVKVLLNSYSENNK